VKGTIGDIKSKIVQSKKLKQKAEREKLEEELKRIEMDVNVTSDILTSEGKISKSNVFSLNTSVKLKITHRRTLSKNPKAT
jgi:hypothetical protein